MKIYVARWQALIRAPLSRRQRERSWAPRPVAGLSDRHDTRANAAAHLHPPVPAHCSHLQVETRHFGCRALQHFDQGRPWPARISADENLNRKWRARSPIWAVLHVSGSSLLEQADWQGPQPMRRIGPGAQTGLIAPTMPKPERLRRLAVAEILVDQTSGRPWATHIARTMSRAPRHTRSKPPPELALKPSESGPKFGPASIHTASSSGAKSASISTPSRHLASKLAETGPSLVGVRVRARPIWGHWQDADHTSAKQTRRISRPTLARC